MDPSEHHQRIALRFRRQRIEQRLGVEGFFVQRNAGPGDRRLDAAKPLRGAHPGFLFTGVELGVHPRLVVGAGDQRAEGFENLFLGLPRQRFGAPSVRQGGMRGGLIPLGQIGAGEREPPLAGDWRITGEAAHGGEIGAFLPQQRLGALAEHRQARPIRVGGDKIAVARKVGAVLVVAQTDPFHQLAAERVGDLRLKVGGVAGPAPAGQLDALFYRGKIGLRQRRRRDCDRGISFKTAGVGANAAERYTAGCGIAPAAAASTVAAAEAAATGFRGAAEAAAPT